MVPENHLLLINPPLSLNRRYGTLGGAGQVTPPIGLLYLASNCRQHRIPCDLLDAEAARMDLKDVVNLISKRRPKFVGISAHTMSIPEAASLAESIHDLYQNIFIILGGPHVSSLPRETLERYPHFHAGVIGEGEQTLVELLTAIIDGRDLEEVPGIVFRKLEEIIQTAPRQYIKNLDELPMPAWDLLPLLKNYRLSSTRFSKPPVGSIITSRGCPGQCAFCDRSVFGRAWRGHGAEYVLEMIKENIRRHHIRSLVINDDTFVVNRKRLVSMCEGMLKENLKLNWSCSARIDELDSDLLALMKRSGCFQIAYGVESGSDKILRAMKKKVSTGHMRSIIEETKKAGIRSKGYFIIGYPGETAETIGQTINFALSAPLDDAQFTFLTPFPGTEIYQEARETGRFVDDWGKMSMWETVFVPEGLSENAMKELRSNAFRRFYLRPKVIGSYAALLAGSPSFSLSLLKDFLSFIGFLIKR